MHDIIVVGAGPAGSLAARRLAEKKYEVLVLEEHESPGVPQHCTGLVSEETLKMSGVMP
jgi:flavin-dependent dehydrogenase